MAHNGSTIEQNILAKNGKYEKEINTFAVSTNASTNTNTHGNIYKTNTYREASCVINFIAQPSTASMPLQLSSFPFLGFLNL